MAAGVPVLNTNDLLAGSILKVEWALWVANYAAATFFDVGAIKDPKMHTEVQDQVIDADNATADLGSFNTKVLAGFDVKILQQSLRTRAIMLGKPTSDVAVVARVAGVSKGTAILGMGALPTTMYLTLRLTMAINVIPGYTEAATDNYILATILIARAKAAVKEEREFGKAKVTIQGVAFKAFHDSSCPAGFEIWKQTDETAL